MRCPQCDSALTAAEAAAGVCPDCSASLNPDTAAPWAVAVPDAPATPARQRRPRLAIPLAVTLGVLLGAGGAVGALRLWPPVAARVIVRAEPEAVAGPVVAVQPTAAAGAESAPAEVAGLAAERQATEEMLRVIRGQVQESLAQLAAAERDQKEAEGKVAAADRQAKEAEAKLAELRTKAGDLAKAEAAARQARARQEEEGRQADSRRAAAEAALGQLMRAMADTRARVSEAEKELAARRSELDRLAAARPAQPPTPAKVPAPGRAEPDRVPAIRPMTPARTLVPRAELDRPIPVPLPAPTKEVVPQDDAVRLTLPAPPPAKKVTQFLREWLVVGPFPAPDRKGHTTYFPTQAGPIDPDKEYKGAPGPVRWRAHTSPADYVDLAALFKTQDPAVGYAVCWVRPAKPGPAQLRLGSNDGIIVWVNGKSVCDRAVSRAAAVDQDRATGDLTAGWNEIRVKVDNTGGPWGFYLDVRDPGTEKPLAGLEVRTTPPYARDKK